MDAAHTPATATPVLAPPARKRRSTSARVFAMFLPLACLAIEGPTPARLLPVQLALVPGAGAAVGAVVTALAEQPALIPPLMSDVARHLRAPDRRLRLYTWLKTTYARIHKT